MSHKSLAQVIPGPWVDEATGGGALAPSLSAPASPKERKKKAKKIENGASISKDLATLSRTALREHYWSEYSSWKNMKQRCKKGEGTLDPRFADFVDFLRHMGAKGSPDLTLDRKDHKNPAYSPENCRWATKIQQTKNRRNSVFLTDESGVTRSLAEWAGLLGCSANTLYTRRRSGWADVEIIRGKRDARLYLGWNALGLPSWFNAEKFEVIYTQTRRTRWESFGEPESRARWLRRYPEQQILAFERAILDKVKDDYDPPDPKLMEQKIRWFEIQRAAIAHLESGKADKEFFLSY